MKTPPVYVWREHVDGSVFAVIARCYMISRGSIFGLSVFILIDAGVPNAWQWRSLGEDYWWAILNKDHAGRLPYCDGKWKAREYGLE